MIKAAKLLIIDPNDHHLLLYRAEHPLFGTDPDLPGGTVEKGESMLEAMLREVQEEAGITIDPSSEIHEIYNGKGYSKFGITYALFATKLEDRPDITMSWEHSSYEWLLRDEFLKRSAAANDHYMHMVAAELQKVN